MILNDTLAIIGMLAFSALLGFLIGWFMKNYKIEQSEGYQKALEDKINRTEEKLQQTEKALIDCQTNRKITEAENEKLSEQFSKAETQKDVKRDQKEKKRKSSKEKKEDKDDFTKIEGIGPKIAGILNEAGILTFDKLAEQSSARISEILISAGGNSYNRFDPGTWPDQAKFAAEGKWDELVKWQDELKGGKKS
jgi:large subunit ribosomal protein L21